MSKIVTYRNDQSGCFCQIKLDSGERILISMAGPPRPSVKISKLLLGIIPQKIVWELSCSPFVGIDGYVKKLMAIFWNGEENPIPTPLDAIRDVLLPCKSIKEVHNVIAEREKSAVNVLEIK